MQHSLVINNSTDYVYIKHGVDFYLGFLDKYHSDILKETHVGHAEWLLRRYKRYMQMLMEDAYNLMARGSTENHKKITHLMDSIYFMYTQAYEHTLALTLKGIS